MDTFVDIRLLELGEQSANYKSVARMLLRTQHRVFKTKGHILDFRSEVFRRRLKLEGARGLVPKTYIECVRCGASALAAAWCAHAELDRATSSFVQDAVANLRHAETAYLLPCGGDLMARDIALLLEVDLDLEGY